MCNTRIPYRKTKGCQKVRAHHETAAHIQLTVDNSKRSGLEKAIYQVEEAIKKRKADNTTNLTTLAHLKKLLSDQGEEKTVGGSQATLSPDEKTLQVTETDVAPTSNAGDDQLEGVENPLQLLARASDLRIASPLTPPGGNASTPGTWLSGSEHGPYLDVQRFFLPMKANLDQGPGLDPVDVGLVTLEEAEMLLTYFHKNLAHTRKYFPALKSKQPACLVNDICLGLPSNAAYILQPTWSALADPSI
jgi:hypothetical protein